MFLITGCNGQLGTCLSKLLPDAICTDRDTLDITDADAVKKFVVENNIDTIINCSAYTAVDRAEDDIETAARVNTDGPRNLAQTGARIIHISTDYVFDGKSNRPYTPENQPNPMSVYGKTKLDGENEIVKNSDIFVIIRTSWLYSVYGNNFVKTMRRLGADRPELNVVCDQIGTPTLADDLARAIVKIIPQMTRENSGVYHFSNLGVCSWYDFATKIMELSNLPCSVKPILSADYPTRATRPFYSVLDKDKITKTFNIENRHWESALRACLSEF